MEVILVILAVIFGPVIFGALVDSGTTAASKAVATARVGQLDLRVRKETRQIEDDSLDGHVFEAKGMPPGSRVPLSLVLHLFDVTDGDAHPIITPIEHLQDQFTRAFEHRLNNVIEPGSYLSDWGEILFLPDLLAMPARKGQRRLLARLSIVPGGSLLMPVVPTTTFAAGVHVDGPAPLRVIESSYQADWPIAGTLDVAERGERAQENIVRLAVAVAGCDGAIDPSEARALKEWAQKRSKEFSDAEQMKNAFNRIISTAREDYLSERLHLESILQQLRDDAEDADRLEALDLCAHVIAADSSVEEEEIQVFDRIVNGLEIEHGVGRSIIDRRALASGADFRMEGSYADLGVSPEMSEADIRARLTAEYKKWNARTNHSDLTMREKAKERLERIVEARRNLLSGG